MTSEDFVAFLAKRKRNSPPEAHVGFPLLLDLDISNNPQLDDLALRR